MSWLQIERERANIRKCVMNLFSRQKQFVTDLEEDLFVELEKVINEFDFVLENYIVEKQLYDRGIDGDGRRLEGYARATIRLKLRKGQPVDRTTLRDENDFHPSIQIKAFSDRFEVSSDVSHAQWILKRYGRKVLKITNDNFREFMNEKFIPNFKDYVESQFAR